MMNLLFLEGCAIAPFIPPASGTHYQKELSLYKGKTVKDVPASWPAPTTQSQTDGTSLVTWPNQPRWGCSTMAVTDSSGTILSWDFKGSSCVLGYSAQEVQQMQAKTQALVLMASNLKRGTPIRLSFYEGAVDVYSHRIQEDLDCYFVSYSKIYGEIAVRSTKPQKKSFNLSKDNTVYELRYISDIVVRHNNE
jgi:hypothetical protein